MIDELVRTIPTTTLSQTDSNRSLRADCRTALFDQAAAESDPRINHVGFAGDSGKKKDGARAMLSS